MKGVTVVDHPLIQHKLTLMRDRTTPTSAFRTLLREISHLLCYEVTRDFELETTAIETPMGPMNAPMVKGKKLVFASILRAGNGLLDGMLDLVPAARVAHIGMYRDHDTLEPIEYYFKAPGELEREPERVLRRGHDVAVVAVREVGAVELHVAGARRHEAADGVVQRAVAVHVLPVPPQPGRASRRRVHRPRRQAASREDS